MRKKRFKYQGRYYDDFGYFKEWCKQNGYKENNPKRLTQFVDGLPLWEDTDGYLYLDDEVEAVNQSDYTYNNNAYAQSNQCKWECIIEKVLEV